MTLTEASHRVGALLLALAVWTAPATPVQAQVASPWIEGYNSRARLIAGSEAGKTFAGIEIEMAEGWKTYWRHPGDSGGVPPSFEWAKSSNLQSAVVLYPAPKRLKDAAGDALGYAGNVIFPARIVGADPARPIRLGLQLEYGICKEICVPAEASLELELPAGYAEKLPEALALALDQVPRVPGAVRASDPKLVASKAVLDGDKPMLEFEVEFPGDADGADAFLEAPDGIYVPQPQPVEPASGPRRRFTVDLTTGVDPSDLKGRKLTLTLVGKAARAQADWQLD